MIDSGKFTVSDGVLKKLRLNALDKFMKECGDAFQYTATVSQYFKIPELFALKHSMYTHDYKRLLEWAHQRYEETGAEQWKVSEKWKKYDPIHKAKTELESNTPLFSKQFQN